MFNTPVNPMTLSLMQGPAAPAAPAAPMAPQPNNMQAFFNNPLTSIGMGMLGGNYGGNSRAAFSNAMKGGMLGMQQARVAQQQQLRSEALKQQMAMAKQQADKEAKMEEKMKDWLVKTRPDLVNAPEIVKEQALKQMFAAPKVHSLSPGAQLVDASGKTIASAPFKPQAKVAGAESIQLANRIASLPDADPRKAMLKARLAKLSSITGTTEADMARFGYDVAEDNTAGRGQLANVMAAESVATTANDMVDNFTEMGHFNLGAVGQGRSAVGGMLSELGGAMGSKKLEGWGETVNPEAARAFREDSQTFATQLVPIVTQEQRFTDAERNMVKELASGEGNWHNNKKASKTKMTNMLDMMINNADVFEKYPAGSAIKQGAADIRTSARFTKEKLSNPELAGAKLGPVNPETGKITVFGPSGAVIGEWE